MAGEISDAAALFGLLGVASIAAAVGFVLAFVVVKLTRGEVGREMRLLTWSFVAIAAAFGATFAVLTA